MRAVEILEQARTIGGEAAMVHLAFGRALESIKNVGGARAAYRAAAAAPLKRHVDVYLPYYRLAELEVAQGDEAATMQAVRRPSGGNGRNVSMRPNCCMEPTRGRDGRHQNW
jgi:hypothetical protein